VERLVRGLHHITLVTGNYWVNSRFFTEVLGLKQVKLSVNQDDIYHRHSFYANPEKPTGSAITFFEWPELPHGFPGLGSPHHLAYRVDSVEALAKWVGWLKYNRVKVKGPYLYNGLVSIYFRDPDNTLLELTTIDEDFKEDYVVELFKEVGEVKSIEPDMRIEMFDHTTPLTINPHVTARFLEKFLDVTNVELIRDSDGRFWLHVSDGEKIIIRYLVDPAAEYGVVGRGSIHHFAVAVESEEEQQLIMSRLNQAKIPNSGIVDRFWFRSLYFRDPSGNLIEVATVGPGYTVDEPPELLGSKLVLPPWLEPVRNNIEKHLAEQDAINKFSWPPAYSDVPEPPEPLPASKA